ncbi:MAG: WbqC family protein [Oscillospiraceae bacterium]
MKNKITLAVMQPYFFPYLGYFQVMNAADKYIVYDDVNYIKRGWANRNFILSNGAPSRINIPVAHASQNKKFNETEILMENEWREKLLKTIEMSYSKAPYFDKVFPILSDIICFEEKCFSDYILHSFNLLCSYMGITTELILSSSLDKDCSLKAEEKIIHICKIVGATDYLNSINGVPLYHYENFEEQGLHLHFHKINDDISYSQFGNEFVPNLSIIDVMMFNSVEEIQQLLTQYTLL